MYNQNPFADVPQVDAAQVYEHFKEGSVDILDVREQDEWDLGHIEGARLIPLGQLQTRRQELDADRKLIVVCRRGNRSNYAALLLRQAGLDAANMEGGMLNWKLTRLPITDPGIIEPH